jgi:hypothetical protein
VSRPKRMNGESSVRTRPDGRYEARVLLRDGRRIMVYGKTAGERTREIRAIKMKHDSGAPIVRNDQKLGAFLETWLERETSVDGVQKTYASYAQVVRGHMLRELAIVKLTELRRGVCRRAWTPSRTADSETQHRCRVYLCRATCTYVGRVCRWTPAIRQPATSQLWCTTWWAPDQHCRWQLKSLGDNSPSSTSIRCWSSFMPASSCCRHCRA